MMKQLLMLIQKMYLFYTDLRINDEHDIKNERKTSALTELQSGEDYCITTFESI